MKRGHVSPAYNSRRKLEVPKEIRQLVGDAMKPKDLESFWNTPHPLLGNKSPSSLWLSGGKDRELVRSHILSAQSGDMA